MTCLPINVKTEIKSELLKLNMLIPEQLCQADSQNSKDYGLPDPVENTTVARVSSVHVHIFLIFYQILWLSDPSREISVL